VSLRGRALRRTAPRAALRLGHPVTLPHAVVLTDTPGQWHYFFMSKPLIHPAHDDISASIAADMQKAEARAVDLGLMRRRADGALELTEAGEDWLFEYVAKVETRH
jgi:hypothetical protein